MLKIYCASGWFAPNQLSAIEMIEETVDELKINTFKPRFANLAKEDDVGDKLDMIFKGNIDAIDNCNLMIVSTVDKDPGTLFEAGMAYAKNIPIIYFNPFMESREKFNLMLARSGLGVCITKAELKDFLMNLTKYEHKGLIE